MYLLSKKVENPDININVSVHRDIYRIKRDVFSLLSYYFDKTIDPLVIYDMVECFTSTYNKVPDIPSIDDCEIENWKMYISYWDILIWMQMREIEDWLSLDVY